MSDEVKKLVEKLNAEWSSFKAENDRRIKEVEAKGRADPLTENKIENHSQAIGAIQAQLDELVKKSQRPNAAGGADEVLAERRKQFAAFMRRDGLQGKAISVRGAVSVGSDPAGGYAVPETLDSEIEKYERDGSPMRELCGQMSLSNENYEKLVEEGEAGSGWLGEQEQPGETTTPTLRALKPYFGLVYAEPKSTQQALDDLSIDVEAWLAEAVGLKFASDENAAFTSGNGVKKPKGILGYALSTSVDGVRTAGQIQKIHSGSSGAFVGDKLIDVVHSLHKMHRAFAVWMMSTLSVAAVRKLKDSNGTYLWQPSLQAGVPSTLLGYSIMENEDVPDPAADANAALFGDFKRAYTVYDVKGITVLRDPFTTKGAVKFFTTKRMGGMVVNDRAVKVLTLST